MFVPAQSSAPRRERLSSCPQHLCDGGSPSGRAAARACTDASHKTRDPPAKTSRPSFQAPGMFRHVACAPFCAPHALRSGSSAPPHRCLGPRSHKLPPLPGEPQPPRPAEPVTTARTPSRPARGEERRTGASICNSLCRKVFPALRRRPQLVSLNSDEHDHATDSAISRGGAAHPDDRRDNYDSQKQLPAPLPHQAHDGLW